MPNGSSLTDDEYEQMQACLSKIDADCEVFRRTIAARLSKEYHDAPLRRLDYSGNDGITRGISISPVLFDRGPNDPFGKPTHVKREAPYYVFYLLAWRDRGDQRFIWHQRFATRETLPASHELMKMLQEMYELCQFNWRQRLASRLAA